MCGMNLSLKISLNLKISGVLKIIFYCGRPVQFSVMSAKSVNFCWMVKFIILGHSVAPVVVRSGTGI